MNKNRELTPQELEALAETIGSSVTFSTDKNNSKKILRKEESTKQDKTKNRPFYKNYLFWAGFSIFVGLVVVAIILWIMVDLNQFLGDGVLQYLATQDLGKDVLQEMERNGAHGITFGLFFYRYRWFVIGGVLLVSIVAALFFLYLDGRRKDKEERIEINKIKEELEEEARLTPEEEKTLEGYLEDEDR